ncbi:MAG: hypothetical protein LBR60_06700 [Fibrobacter sp.]|jgi:hypothetical protein|nr:hypothetical protein [Fibrobacter sp.]
MKPSLYFADRLRFFLKRFRSEASLAGWFWKKAGNAEAAFSHSFSFSCAKNHLIFLPENPQTLKIFEPFLQKLTSGNNIFVQARSPFLRYGELRFLELEKEIANQKIDCCLYLNEELFLPFLYLAKKSGAPYRIGFRKNAGPSFFNISLMAETSAEQLALLQNQYQEVSSCPP